MYVRVYLCRAPWPNEKRCRSEIWHTYSHWPYLKTGFFVFSIKSPWRPLASKNCRVTWIFRNLLDCLVLLCFIFFSLYFVVSIDIQKTKNPKCPRLAGVRLKINLYRLRLASLAPSNFIIINYRRAEFEIWPVYNNMVMMMIVVNIGL